LYRNGDLDDLERPNDRRGRSAPKCDISAVAEFLVVVIIIISSSSISLL